MPKTAWTPFNAALRILRGRSGSSIDPEREETMLNTSGINLRGYHREIIDYMRDTYGIEDVTVKRGGKHLQLEYVYAGRRHKNTLPRNNYNDRNWIDTRKHDLRKELGEPPPLAPEAKSKRSLDDMTQEIQAKTDLMTTTAIGAVIEPIAKPTISQPISQPGTGKTITAQPAVKQKTFACTIGALKNDIAFYLGRDLAEAMDRQFGKNRRYVVVYHYPNAWTAKPSRDAGRAIEEPNHRLRCTGTEVIKRLGGRFPATKAEAIVRHNRVELRLTEPMELVKAILDAIEAAPPTPAPKEAARPAATPYTAPVVTPFIETPLAPEPPIPPPAPPPPSAPAPVNQRERLRAVLRAIKEIEDEGIYTLIPGEEWRWRAYDIKLED
jgi:hypothetical protein